MCRNAIGTLLELTFCGKRSAYTAARALPIMHHASRFGPPRRNPNTRLPRALVRHTYRSPDPRVAGAYVLPVAFLKFPHR